MAAFKNKKAVVVGLIVIVITSLFLFIYFYTTRSDPNSSSIATQISKGRIIGVRSGRPSDYSVQGILQGTVFVNNKGYWAEIALPFEQSGENVLVFLGPKDTRFIDTFTITDTGEARFTSTDAGDLLNLFSNEKVIVYVPVFDSESQFQSLLEGLGGCKAPSLQCDLYRSLYSYNDNNKLALDSGGSPVKILKNSLSGDEYTISAYAIGKYE